MPLRLHHVLLRRIAVDFMIKAACRLAAETTGKKSCHPSLNSCCCVRASTGGRREGMFGLSVLRKLSPLDAFPFLLSWGLTPAFARVEGFAETTSRGARSGFRHSRESGNPRPRFWLSRDERFVMAITSRPPATEITSYAAGSGFARTRRSFDRVRFFFSSCRHFDGRFSNPMDVAPSLAGYAAGQVSNLVIDHAFGGAGKEIRKSRLMKCRWFHFAPSRYPR